MNTKSFACAAVAAVVMAGLAPKTWAGNLPLLTDGLVMQLDASDTSTMTMLGEGQLVTEWRSKVGDITFGLRAWGIGDDTSAFRRGEEVRVRFSLPVTRVGTLFENGRPVTHENDGFSDSFAPNEVHVYRLR